MKQFQSVKTILCLAFVCLLILVGAPSARADLYRIGAVVDYANCDGAYYCTMLESLAITPGATLYLFIEYDPNAAPKTTEECGWGRVASYDSQITYLSTPSGHDVAVMVGLDPPSLILVDEYEAAWGGSDSVRWYFKMSDEPCPDVNPCFRVEHSYQVGRVEFAMYDTDATAHDDFELPEILTPELYEVFAGVLIYIEDLGTFERLDVYAFFASIQRWEPPEMMTALVETVMELNINNGISNALDAKLESALEALDDANAKNDVSACNRLQAFLNSVEAQRGTHLSDSDADKVIADAQEIITALGCQ